MIINTDVPKDKNYPEDSVQCDCCGGRGCKHCHDKGWFTPKWHHLGRECENLGCKVSLKPNNKGTYCCTKCEEEDKNATYYVD